MYSSHCPMVHLLWFISAWFPFWITDENGQTSKIFPCFLASSILFSKTLEEKFWGSSLLTFSSNEFWGVEGWGHMESGKDFWDWFYLTFPQTNLCGFFVLQEVMSAEDESTSCYCLMDSTSCHLLLDQPGSYALVGDPLTEAAVKRLKLAVFGSMGVDSMEYSLRVYCVDDTPHAFQVWKAFMSCSCVLRIRNLSHLESIQINQ